MLTWSGKAGTPNRRIWRYGLVVTFTLVLAIGGWIALATFRQPTDRLPTDGRHLARMIVMQEHLATQQEPFIIVAGDSHAELLNWNRICGLPVVNLGFSGMAAAQYDKVLARLNTERRAELAIVFLGTNDLVKSLKPDREASLTRFEQRISAVLTDMRRFSAKSFYAPVFPSPIDSRASARFAVHKAEQYKMIASKVCRAEGCQSLALDNLDLEFDEDGIHLDRAERTSGGALHQLVEATVCPSGAL